MSACRARHGRARDGDRERHARGAVEALDGPEAGDRAQQHHPLDAEVEHPRALGEQLAERGEEERCPVDDRRREHHDEEAVVHPARPPPTAGAGRCGRATTTRYRTSTSPPSTQKRMSPCITPTRPDGKSAPWSV